MTPEQVREGRYGMEFAQVGGLPMAMAAQGCTCSYTWADGKPVRNGPSASCEALHPEDITVTVDGGDPVQGEWGEARHVPGLEQRVAALEELIARPLVTVEYPEWTDEQAEKLKGEWEAWSGRTARGNEFRLLPPAPVLTPETAQALMRECVTVVSPGETLVIRVPETWTPQQAEYYNEYCSAVASFPVLVVIASELAVAPGEPDDDARP